MALQWRQPPNALKAAKTLGEMLITLALSYASPYFIYVYVWFFGEFSGWEGGSEEHLG